MKIFQNFVILVAALSALSFTEGEKCQFLEYADCVVNFCNEDPDKPCKWNNALTQCHCPHEGGDGGNNCAKVDDEDPCGGATCINVDKVEIGCVDKTVKNLPGFLNQKFKKCECPPTCSDPEALTCSTAADSCGNPIDQICDKGVDGETCRCRVKCGSECDCDEQNCQDGCYCVQEFDDDGLSSSTCKPFEFNSPCNCNTQLCGTGLTCAERPSDTCACKVDEGFTCNLDEDCGTGFCNPNNNLCDTKIQGGYRCEPGTDVCETGFTCKQGVDTFYYCTV